MVKTSHGFVSGAWVLAFCGTIQATPLSYTSALSGQSGTYMADSFRVVGGTGPYTCLKTSGALPNGLYQANCGFEGTPSTPGTGTMVVTIMDGSTPTLTTSGSFTLTISAAAAPQPLSSGAGMVVGSLGSLGGFVMSPNDAWHADISHAAIDPLSDAILVNGSANDMKGYYLHPDFGAPAPGAVYGIPYDVVDTAVTPHIFEDVKWNCGWQATEGDTAVYPIPPTVTIESVPGECVTAGDQHAIVLDKHTLALYEFYQMSHCSSSSNSGWNACNGTIWDMTKTEDRPWNFTSVDAAGLSVFEGLLTYDDITRGALNHALRFTVRRTHCDHYSNGDPQGTMIPPATHSASCGNGNNDIPIGMRIRLKADFNISGFSPVNQIILNGMKKYGMIVADNGENLYFQGTPDPRWDNDDLNFLKNIRASDFEVIAMVPQIVQDAVPTGPAPVINSFTASVSTVTYGSPVTLTAIIAGGSYQYTDAGGFFRDTTQTVILSTTTTFTLNALNRYGRTTATATVAVTGGPSSSVSAGLSSVRVYPNPWRHDLTPVALITFDQLQAGSSIKIFGVSGHEVKELTSNSNGIAVWDLTTKSGDHAASGIYLYAIKPPNGDTLRGKLALIR